MKQKLRILSYVVGVLLVVAVIGFVITDKEPLYSQGRGGSNSNKPVPDLIGTWQVDGTAYFIEDVNDFTAPDGVPEFIQGPFEDIIITDQTGRVFAGIGVGGNDHVTGVILSDGTVSMQLFELTELRGFLTGTLDGGGTTLEISGFFHVFDDFGAASPSDTNMASAFVQMVKVN